MASIQVTSAPMEQWPNCPFCGVKVNPDNLLTNVDIGGQPMHPDCYTRWRAQIDALGGEGRTYWTMQRVEEQLRKIQSVPHFIRIVDFTREHTPLTDILRVNVILDAVEPDGRHNPFQSTITCTAPMPTAKPVNNLDPTDAVEEWIDNHVLNRQQRRRMMRELKRVTGNG